jgi:hypothetical protein
MAESPLHGVRRIRIVLGTAGIALMLFGAFRLLTQVPLGQIVVLVVWLAAALVLHDGILSPSVVGIGVLLARIPRRARRFVQGGLVAGALVTIIAVPMILRQGSQPPQKALLRQDFGANLLTLLAIVAAGTLALYAIKLVSDSRGSKPNRTSAAASATNVRPSEDHTSSQE